MTEEIADAASLPVLEITPLEAETYSGHSVSLMGVCRNVEIRIGDVRNKINVFVVSEAAHPLLLGMPYWCQVSIVFDYNRSDRSVYVTVISDDAKYRVRFKILSQKGLNELTEKTFIDDLKN